MKISRTFKGLMLTLLASCGLAQAGTVTIESWRVDDKTLWETVLIPAFQRKHPDVQVKFAPTPPTEYDSSLTARLAGGTAGDLIVCESGGCVSAHDGSPLLYNRAKPLQKSLICAGPTLYDALIARMREVTFPYQPR